MSISTNGGMIWASVHILVSVAMLAELVSAFDGLRSEWNDKKDKMEQLDSKMDAELLPNLIATISKLDPNPSPSRRVSQMQFMLGMLKESGVLSEEDIAPLEHIFKKVCQMRCDRTRGRAVGRYAGHRT